MVFCNKLEENYAELFDNVTILILVDGFLQCDIINEILDTLNVTILILVDGFLQ